VADNPTPEAQHVIEVEIVGGEVTKSLRPRPFDKGETAEAPVPQQGLSVSTSFYCSNGSAQFPAITINHQTIYVRHETTGGGSHVVTRLNGSGGLFLFAEPGTYQITPGAYKHFSDGNVLGNGCIKSIVTYS
jgi:hypothetical protein